MYTFNLLIFPCSGIKPVNIYIYIFRMAINQYNIINTYRPRNNLFKDLEENAFKYFKYLFITIIIFMYTYSFYIIYKEKYFFPKI